MMTHDEGGWLANKKSRPWISNGACNGAPPVTNRFYEHPMYPSHCNHLSADSLRWTMLVHCNVWHADVKHDTPATGDEF
jgi:hypothetical protein